MRPDLSGQVAVVTGASRGIGHAFACGLAGAGAHVVPVARSAVKLQELERRIAGSGARATAFSADVTDGGAVEQLVQRVESEIGPIDLLVNNAGVMSPIGRDWEVDPAAWWRTMEVNVLGCFLSARAVLPRMIERRRGRIVNVTSSAANKRYPFYSAYGASKAAVSHLTGSLAEATRESGVAVFALSPGFVRTEMTESLASAPAIRQHLGDGFRRALDEGRHTPVEAVVDALLFLASGSGDVLSGEHVDVRDDIEKLARLASERSTTRG
jgi:NAD(P)-dependent dehydrogenase (short-subunit alcohol dehydrogenase family)